MVIINFIYKTVGNANYYDRELLFGQAQSTSGRRCDEETCEGHVQLDCDEVLTGVFVCRNLSDCAL